MISSKRLSLGRWGEQVAACFLEETGYMILEANIRTHYGEIDLLAKKDDVLIFVEVKTRRSTSLGFPEISITPKKMMHIIASAEAYLQAHPELTIDWRIDVISILRLDPEQPPEIAHFENVNDVH